MPAWRPGLTVIVPCHDMVREVPRTVASLSPAYQRVAAERYDVRLVEMPSANMLGPEQTEAFASNVTHVVEPENLPLAVAVNRAVRRTDTSHVMICIDGARIVSAGVVHSALEQLRMRPRAITAFHGLHLDTGTPREGGVDDVRARSATDRLLESIDFPNAPGRLWDVAAWSGPSSGGWFLPMTESHAFSLPRDHFEALGGYDERVDGWAAGVSNRDFYNRAIADPRRPLVHVLGEGTFSQRGDSGRDTQAGAAGEFERMAERAPASNDRPTFVFAGALSPRTVDPARRSLLALAQRGDRGATRPAAAAVQEAERRAFASTARAAPRPPMTLIVGMHRSATSYLARQLVRAGHVVPGTPMDADVRTNPQGHHEPLEIVAWHDAVLADAGGSWRAVRSPDWRAMGDDWFEWRAHGLRRLLLDLDDGDPDAEGWVVKDPRMCLALPLWDRALRLMDVRPTVLHAMRHPAAVAASLHRRNRITPEIGRLIWARYVHDQLAWVDDANDAACVDATTTDELSALLSRVVGPLDVPIEALKPRAVTGDGPIDALYERFVRERDVTALRNGLATELAFLDRHPAIAALVDANATL